MSIVLTCSSLLCRRLGTFRPRKLSARTPCRHKDRHGRPWHSPRPARVPLCGSPYGPIICAAACVPLCREARGPNGGGSPLHARPIFRFTPFAFTRMRCHSVFHLTTRLAMAPSCGSVLPSPCHISFSVLRVLFATLLSSRLGMSSCFCGEIF